MKPRISQEFVGPSGNFDLSPQDFAAACDLCDTMSALRDNRIPYLESAGLDKRIFLPGHMCDQAFLESNFNKMARKDYRTINHLRCLTYNFTGFHMLTMEPSENTPDVLEIPADAEQMIRSAAPKLRPTTLSFVQSMAAMPSDRIVDAPRIFGECGWDVDGTVVNCDTWSAQQRINGLHYGGVLDFLKRRIERRGHVRVLEIGAGYGNMAYNLKRMLGPIDYHIVDLPDSMIYSSIYLNTLLAGERRTIARAGQPLPETGPGVTFIANYMFEEFLPQIGEFDFVINTLSLSEMSALQVDYYADRVAGLIGADGIFFEQNYTIDGIHTNVVPIFQNRFPYGAELEETPAPHRGRGTIRIWANQYCSEVWNRGGIRPLATRTHAKVGGIEELPPRELIQPRSPIAQDLQCS